MNDELGKKVLLRAAELVERGWCQGVLGMRSTPEKRVVYFVGIGSPLGLTQADRVCLDGALMLAVHEVTGDDLDTLSGSVAYRAGRDALTEQMERMRDGQSSYVAWNDMPGRTADQVAALCRRVAAE